MTRVLVLQPGERAVAHDFDPAKIWTEAQRIVGGYVEIAYLTRLPPGPEPFSLGWHLAAYVNEDGIAQGLPLAWAVASADGSRFYHLFGPVVVVRERVDGEGDTFYTDITLDDERWVARRFNAVTQPARRQP